MLGKHQFAPRLSGRIQIDIKEGSLAYSIYRHPRVSEEFSCNYELNPAFQPAFSGSGLEITGEGKEGETRIIEFTHNQFFLATAS